MYRQGLNILTPFWNWIYLSPFCPQFLNLTGTEYTKGLSAWGWLLGICYRQKRERNKVRLFISLFTSSRFYKLAISLNHRAYIAPFNSTLQCQLCLQVLETPPHCPASWLREWRHCDVLSSQRPTVSCLNPSTFSLLTITLLIAQFEYLVCFAYWGNQSTFSFTNALE